VLSWRYAARKLRHSRMHAPVSSRPPARHVAAVAELRDSVAAVEAADSLSIDGYMVELANEIVRVLDAVMLPLGEELRELSMRDGQPTALGAKSTLPQTNPFNVSLHVLRSGGMSTGRWARALAEFVAPHELAPGSPGVFPSWLQEGILTQE
jgi:hypothetical protein